MASKLHALVAGLSEADLALLVKVAFEGINDCDAMKEIAGIVDMKPEDILSFGERVVAPLVTPAETAMGWYAKVYSVDKLALKLLGYTTKSLTQPSIDCLKTALHTIAEYATETNRTVDSTRVVCELVQMNSLDRQHVEPIVRIMLSRDFEAKSSVNEDPPVFLLNKTTFYSPIGFEAFAELHSGCGWGSDAHRTATKNHFDRLAKLLKENSFQLPEGWTREEMPRTNCVTFNAPSHAGFVTVDFEHRIFRSGLTTVGPVPSAQKYADHAWKDQLCADAVQWLTNNLK